MTKCIRGGRCIDINLGNIKLCKKKQCYYTERIQNRSTFRYILGLYPRLKRYIYFAYARYIARKNGAEVGENVTMYLSLAKSVNKNLKIGNNVSIGRGVSFSSFRYKCTIGDNVIIGTDVRFVMGTHNIDSPEWEHMRKSPEGLYIGDYAWLCPDSCVLPSVNKIGKGAVIGANSVVCKDVEDMSVVGGNPAKHLRYRKCVHENLVVESLLAGDLKRYWAVKHSNEST